MQVSGETIHALPSQLVLVEWGPEAAALPAASEQFDSGWFDTWRAHGERVIQPKSGLQGETTDESILGAGTHRRAGVYFLDLFCFHQNATRTALQMQLQTAPAPVLLGALPPIGMPRLQFAVMTYPDLGIADRKAPGFSRSFRLRHRMVRLTFFYATTPATTFYLSAVLRSG